MFEIHILLANKFYSLLLFFAFYFMDVEQEQRDFLKCDIESLISNDVITFILEKYLRLPVSSNFLQVLHTFLLNKMNSK